jgi:hypothetical protein
MVYILYTYVYNVRLFERLARQIRKAQRPPPNFIEQSKICARDDRLQHVPCLDTTVCDLDHIPVRCNRTVTNGLLSGVLPARQEAWHNDVVQVGQVGTKRSYTLVVAQSDVGWDRSACALRFGTL